MERYSKRYSSKWQSQYSDEFKRFVCNDFLTGTLTRRSVERKYKIGNTRLDYWLKELGYDYTKPRLVPLLMTKTIPTDSEGNHSVSKLKQDLEDAQLLAEAYRRMIDIAERELKINIRKKSDTK